MSVFIHFDTKASIVLTGKDGREIYRGEHTVIAEVPDGYHLHDLWLANGGTKDVRVEINMLSKVEV